MCNYKSTAIEWPVIKFNFVKADYGIVYMAYRIKLRSEC